MSAVLDSDSTAAWNNASAAMNRYFSILIFLFGTSGNLLNTLVLSQRTLRRNPCTSFFLVSSIANLVAILSGLTTRILSGWALDLTNTVDWLCKCRAFALFLSRNVASWLIMLAAIDRWLLSSVHAHRRELSTLKNARRGILLTVLLSVLLYGPIFYCYEANLTNAPLRCYGKNDGCRYSNDINYACLTIILPILCMLFFGVLTIVNIRQVRSRVHVVSFVRIYPTGIPSLKVSVSAPLQAVLLKRKLDRRLFLMLVSQIILLGIFTLPQAFQKLYSTITVNSTSTPVKRAIQNFLFNLVLLLTYLANGIPFYIYTLSGGSVFRNALKGLLRNLCLFNK